MRKLGILFGTMAVVVLFAQPVSARRTANSAPIAVSGPNVFMAWTAPPAGQDLDQIFFRRSEDGGSNWLPQKQLTSLSSYAAAPALAVSGSNVFIAYHSYELGPNQVFLLRSTSRGKNWETPFNLSDDVNPASNPAIVAMGSVILVLWQGVDGGYQVIRYTRSLDNGLTWHTAKTLHASNGMQFQLTAAAEGNTVCVAYSEIGGSASYVNFIRSLDGGSTWQDYRHVLSVNGTYLNAGQIDLRGPQVNLIWTGNNGTPLEQAMFSKSIDGGMSWLPAVQLSQSSSGASFPTLAHSGASAYLAYGNVPTGGDSRVYFRRSLNSGTTWQLSKYLSPALRDSQDPTVAAAGSQVFVCYWAVEYNALGVGLTLYLRISLDRGATWGAAKIISFAQILLH